MTPRLALACLVIGGGLLSGPACGGPAGITAAASVDVAGGRRLAGQYGCAACHAIPGADVTGFVGPPLRDLARRAYLAGAIPNTPDRLIEWIRFPDRVRPGTLMPDTGVSDEDARTLAAFLYSL